MSQVTPTALAEEVSFLFQPQDCTSHHALWGLIQQHGQADFPWLKLLVFQLALPMFNACSPLTWSRLREQDVH